MLDRPDRVSSLSLKQGKAYRECLNIPREQKSTNWKAKRLHSKRGLEASSSRRGLAHWVYPIRLHL